MSPRRYLFAICVMVSTMQAASAHTETIQIVMDKLAFTPVAASASVGDTITWINNDILAHTATARNGDWDVTIAPKKTVSLVLKKAGTIEYYCRFHPNMTGRVVIAPK
jgi:plastocyanin